MYVYMYMCMYMNIYIHVVSARAAAPHRVLCFVLAATTKSHNWPLDTACIMRAGCS